MADRPPGVVRALLAFSRELLTGIGRMVADPALLAATRQQLNLPPPSGSGTDVSQVNQRLREIDSKLAQFEAQPGEDLSLDAQIAEFLVGGQRMVELIEVMLPGKAADDPRTYGDIAYAFATLFASEWLLRPKAPWAYALVRLLMLGYERIEDVPRFDPFHIYDRITGHASSTSAPGFGGTEAIGGIAIPVAVLLINWLLGKLAPEAHELEKGDPYLAGELAFKLGWEPSPDVPPELQTLLARALTLAFTGKVKVHEEGHESALTFLLTAVGLEEADGGPGFLLRGGGAGEFKLALPGASRGAIKRSLEFKAVGGPGADYMWNTERGEFRFLGASGGEPSVELALESRGTEHVPTFRIGKAGKSRFDLIGVKLGWTVGPGAQFGYLELQDGLFLVKFEDLIPVPGVKEFFASVGADKIGGRIDGKLKLDAREGLVFEGEAGLKARLATHASVPVVPGTSELRFDYLDLELGLSSKKGFSLGGAVAARFKIGTFAASVDRVGFTAIWEQEDGKMSVREEFKPPKGIGLRLELPGAEGGGFLLLDYDKGEFAGAFELTLSAFKGMSIQVIVILNTKVPGAKVPFALFVLGHVRFPGGIELGFRFTLNAVGLLVGLQHGFDRAALESALPSGAMDDVLFPKDVVGDAPRVINSLRSIFPIRPGALTLGFMLELGWGADKLCSLRLGLILPFENVFARQTQEDESRPFKGVILLGRIAVVAFADVPKPIRISLICDFVGEIGFDPFSVRFYARLRDSRFGTFALEGAIVFSLQTGPNARLLIAAGGFHPNYKNVPTDLPAPLDRMAVTYDIGLVKAWLRAYFAVAPGTLQFGAEIGIRYTFGPLSLGGEFGFDALIQLPPRFSFEATVYGSVGVKYRGRSLMGVSVRLTLWGPSQWRAKGRGQFTLLFWDVSIDFDESWGKAADLEQDRVHVASLVLADLRDRSHWQLELPRNSDLLVALSSERAAAPGELLGHPLSVLVYTQHRVPFGLELQRYGTANIDGTHLFPVPQLTDEQDRPLGDAQVRTEAFAVAEYRDLSDDERLSQPGFQPLPAGIASGGGAYALPAVRQDVPLTYEEVFLDTGQRGAAELREIDLGMLGRLAGAEAAGLSELRWREKLGDPALEGVATRMPDWVAAEPEQLRPTQVGNVPAWAAQAPAFLRAQPEVGAKRLLLVEAFEAES
jgi:hypothetical protein